MGLPFTVIVAFSFLTKLLLNDIKVIPLEFSIGSYVVIELDELADCGFEDEAGLLLEIDEAEEVEVVE